MLNLKIALTFLIKSPKKTLITIFSIALGISLFHFILNSSQNLKSTVLSTSAYQKAHITLTGDINIDNRVYNNKIKSKLRNKDNLITDISFTKTTSIKTTLESALPYNLKGVNFKDHGYIQRMSERVLSRENNEIPTDTYTNEYDVEIMISSSLASELGFIANQSKYEDLYDKIVKFQNTEGKKFKMKITSVFVSDVPEIAKTIFTTINNVERISNNTTNALEINVKDPMDSTKVLNRIRPILEEEYPIAAIVDWQQGNNYIVNAIYIEDISIFLIQLFTILAISFSTSVLLMFQVKRKTKQIGILKTIGLTEKNSILIFLYQSIITSTLAILLGIYAGTIYAHLVNITFKRKSGIPLISLNTSFYSNYSVITFGLMFLLTLLASLFPTVLIKKLKIIEVIKNE